MPTALITGASSGIGEQFAYALAREKYDLVLTARREDRLNAIAGNTRERGAGRAEIIAIDLAARDAPRRIFERLSAARIEIDYLVNNAGFGTSGRFDRLPLERELEEIDLNVTALAAMTRLFLPAMAERRRGTIINVASTAAFQGLPYMATYAASKAFVLSFTEAIAGEMAGTGVRVMALCPGPVKTEFQAIAKNEKGMIPAFVYADSAALAARAVAAAAAGRTVYISGAINFVAAQANRFVPRALVNRIARRIYRDASGD
jgi:short-subunit dehydrogenase